jgi:hypothetical protein
MADKKISQLTALDNANLASGDVLPIVDVDAGATKKISVNQLMGSVNNGVVHLNASGKPVNNSGVLVTDVGYVEIAKPAAGAVGPVLYLHNTVNSASGGHAAEIRFNLRELEDTTRNAVIRAVTTGSFGSDPALSFLTSSGTAGTPTERLRVAPAGDVTVSTGNLVIGTAGKGVTLPGGITWTSGSGSPEGVVTAPIGSLYSRSDGGLLTSLYVKESGSGNTGWVGK